MDWERQLQDETRNISVLRFGATYIMGLTVNVNGPTLPLHDGQGQSELESIWMPCIQKHDVGPDGWHNPCKRQLKVSTVLTRFGEWEKLNQG